MGFNASCTTQTGFTFTEALFTGQSFINSDFSEPFGIFVQGLSEICSVYLIYTNAIYCFGNPLTGGTKT
jgi:hypothetical protein